MSIPKYNELMPDLLDHVLQLGPIGWRALEAPMAQVFGLSDEEVTREYDSGNGTVFLDRISWALSHMVMAGVLERPGRGVYQATELGTKLAGQREELLAFVKAKMAERNASRQATEAEQDDLTGSDDDSAETPHEALLAAYGQMRSTSCNLILETILQKTPTEFERLVVKLLDRMGYGGLVKDAGTVTQASNDGGIDGIIKEDVLGLGRIHIQAKRYKQGSTVGREEIQKFVGALAVAQSNKGVFITTSSFTAGAKQYAADLNGVTNLVLIDGAELAEFIYDYGLGMQTEQQFELKKMDVDFWDQMQDEAVIQPVNAGS